MKENLEGKDILPLKGTLNSVKPFKHIVERKWLCQHYQGPHINYDCLNMKDRKIKAFLVKEESDSDMINLDKEIFKAYY